MKNKSLLLAVAISATLLAGCKNGVNGNLIASSGMSAYKAATLSDADVYALAKNACKLVDCAAQVA
ncbi:metalloprotease, partial [Salmonella enterica subsp. enterica serovar Poona]